MDPLSVLILAIVALAGVGLAAVLGGAESRDGFDRSGAPDRRPGINGPAFR